jgi:hypothetical protein
MRRTLAILLCETIIALLSVSSVAMAEEIEGVEIHIFASQGFLVSSDGIEWPITESSDGTFKFNEFGMNFSKQLNPKLRVGMQLFAQSRGDYGNDKVTLDWAYADYRFKDYFGARVGKIKMPLGLYNETRDTDQLRTFVLLPQNLYDDRYRETVIASTGFALYGTTPTTKAGSLAYHFQIGGLTGDPEGGIAKQVEAFQPGVKVQEFKVDTTPFGSLEWRTPLPGLRFAASRMESDTTIYGPYFEMRTKGYSKTFFSGEYTWRDLVLAAEYGREKSTTIIGPYSTRGDQESWYGSGTYRFNEKIEAGSYYAVRYADATHHNGSTYMYLGFFHPYNMWQKDWTSCLRVDPRKNVALKLEVHKINGTALAIVQTPTAKEHWWVLATKATVYF